MPVPRLLIKLYRWRIRSLNDTNFLLILSVLIGFLSGVAAVIIKNTVRLIESFMEGQFLESHRYFYVLLPVIGILLVLLFTKFLLRRKVDHGIPTVLYAISKNNGIIRPHNIFSSVISSAITVGFGGSVGLEGPTVATGAAIGSNIAKILRLNYRQVILMLGCASAGAMSAIFKAPIAGVVFALEVIMLNLTMTTIIPLIIASVMGTLTAYFFLGQDTLYTTQVDQLFRLREIPYYVILGVITGFTSLYFSKTYFFIAHKFEKIRSWYFKLLTGGLILGIIIFVFPALYGEGYDIINSVINGQTDALFRYTFYGNLPPSFGLLAVVMIALVIFKVVAMSVTFSSGGVGGVFAPSLFLGSVIGLLFVLVLNSLGLDLPVKHFTLVGMAGVIAGVIQAPLTAIFLIAEITGGYELLLPLMITATISYFTIRLFETTSIYTYQLAKRGELLTHHQDKTVLSLMDVSDLIETNFNTIKPDSTLGDLVEVISGSQRNIFPVVDEKETLLGVVWVNDIRHIVFKTELYKTTYVRDLMFMPTPTVSPHESMEGVAHKFQTSSNYNLPVIEDGKYLGFVSRANVFSKYRTLIKEFSED